ncbi:MAG: hypothetical protein DRJ03_02555 [Chloroflexi bacterium]|nr:MAG: hypothetical protein DRJ03_02555 [Chloroflexota bacterium]
MNKEQTITTYRYVNQRYALDRFEDAALEDLSKYYTTARKKTEAAINRAIKKNLDLRSTNRLKALLAEIDDKIEQLTEAVTKPVAEAAGEAGAYSYRNTNDILSWDGAVDSFDNVAMSASQLATIAATETLGGHTLDGWLWSALNEENQALKAEIAQARIRGISYKKIMAELPARYNNLLAGADTKRNLETVVKSYIQSMNAKAHKDIYEANKDVIKGVEWSAIMENGNTKTGRGTCSRCMSLDGMEYDTIDSGPNCPLHPRCRCMYLPVTKSWKELGFTDEETEELGTKYNKWYERDMTKEYYVRGPKKGQLKPPSRQILDYGETSDDFAGFWATKPEWWQDNAIGPRRADLVRAEVVDFDELVIYDKNYQKLVNKKLGKDYELGDQILVEDLYTIYGGRPIPKGTSKPVPKPAPKPEVFKTKHPSAQALYDNAPSKYQTQYYRNALAADSDYVLNKLDTSEGPYYLDSSKLINMNPGQDSIQSAVTFIHEFGHRTDYKYYDKMAPKWGETTLYRNSITATPKFQEASKLDATWINNAQKREKSLFPPPKGKRYSRRTWDASREDYRMNTYGDITLIKEGTVTEKLNAMVTKGLKDEDQYLLDITNNTIKEFRDNITGGLITEAGVNHAEQQALIALHSYAKSGADSFVLRDWLDSFKSLFATHNITQDTLLLADSIGGTTAEKFFGYGHGHAYYTAYPTRKASETFANMFALSGDPNAVTFYKKYLPKQFKLFTEFTEVL